MYSAGASAYLGLEYRPPESQHGGGSGGGDPPSAKDKINLTQQQAEAYRKLAENGPGIMYLLAIQLLSTKTFLVFAFRRAKKSPTSIVKSDAAFVVWYAIFNTVYACVLGYVMWRRWIPQVPPRTFFSLMGAFPGVFASVFIEYICKVGDKRATRLAISSDDGFSRRIWMHAIVGMVVSVALMAVVQN